MTIEVPLAPGAGVSDGDGVPAVQVHEEPLPRRRRFLDLLDPDLVELLMGVRTQTFGYAEVVAEQDTTTLLEVRGPGDVIGRAGCSEAQERSSTVTSVGSSLIRLLRYDDLRAVLRTYPPAGAAAAEVLIGVMDRSCRHFRSARTSWRRSSRSEHRSGAAHSSRRVRSRRRPRIR